MFGITPSPTPEKKKRNVFYDLRKFLSDINIRATRGAFQSGNFLEETTGWRLNASGLIEGTRLKLDNFVPATDSSIAYSGTWANSTILVGYTLTAKRSSTIGDTFTITFTGTSIGVVIETAADQGKVSFSLDGGTPTLVDLYYTYSNWRNVVYSAEGLHPGEHTLVGTVATKNASATDNFVRLQGYVKSPTDGIKLSDTAFNLFTFATSNVTTDGNGYAESSSFTLPNANTIVVAIVGVFFNDEAVMSDATLTEPKICWRDQTIYLYNGAASTTYEIGRLLITSRT